VQKACHTSTINKYQKKWKQVQDRSYNTLVVLTGNEILFENCENRWTFRKNITL
jgi:hypothetical protein